MEVLNEAEILLADGKTIRPDRMMISGEKCTILDYKTGADGSVDRNGHKTQLISYKKAAEDMGYDPVSAYLYYVDTDELINVN